MRETQKSAWRSLFWISNSVIEESYTKLLFKSFLTLVHRKDRANQTQGYKTFEPISSCLSFIGIHLLNWQRVRFMR